MNRLTRRLDPRLDKIDAFRELTDAESVEFEHHDAALKDLESNMTLSGTTASMIDRRDAEFGIVSNASKPIEQRRSVLVAKLRGQGTTTKAFIKNVALSFEYGEIDVVDDQEPYTVHIIFESVMGVPPNMDDFIATLEAVKPAHISFEYIYKYNTWDDFEAFHHTFDEWEAIHVTWDELMTYKEDDSVSALQNTIRKAVSKLGVGK